MSLDLRTVPPRRWAAPVFLAVVLASMLVTATIRTGQADPPGPGLLVFVLLTWLPLLARTRYPVAVMVVVTSLECLHIALLPSVVAGANAAELMGAYQPVPIATMVAVFTVASRRPQRFGWASGGTAGVLLLVTGVLSQPSTLLATDFVVFNLIIMAAGAGVLITARRERRERDARDRVQETNRHVTAERLRIARDLHDVVAHHLTLVNAQAGVAGYLLGTNPPAARAALKDITAHTRQALDELRATVGLLRSDGEPAEALHPVPGLDRLDDLIAGFTSADAPVTQHTSGSPVPLTGSAETSAYRIVQEALTNAAKHAPGAAVAITLAWSPQGLHLTVENGPGRRPHYTTPPPSSGHGLVGMRERAQACGGEVWATRTTSGGFAVRASLPAHSAYEA
ncbi:signal transduction histidine kinase [Actinoplanes tereljensis]|uniref:histidine kinase n=1 Tax=Paractinoplanes tereljensis TaxID=571912 RepID=A0A919NTA4_9ACTN|nr:sensor histidine kinase [Actinoplanes tereljensis]GIF23865.1 ATPase [Actinoplanes tereljensis]